MPAHSGREAIMLVHPNNPTGPFTKPWEVEALADLCRTNGLALIVDEVFLDYPFPGQKRRRSFAAWRVLQVAFGRRLETRLRSLPPQMKAGWIVATGPERTEAMSRLGHCRYISVDEHLCSGLCREAVGRRGFRIRSGHAWQRIWPNWISSLSGGGIRQLQIEGG